MDFSAIEPTARPQQPYSVSTGMTGTATDTLFADLLFGITDTAGDDNLSDEPYGDDVLDDARDDARAETDDDTPDAPEAKETTREARGAKNGKAGIAVTAELADPLATPEFGADAQVIPTNTTETVETGVTPVNNSTSALSTAQTATNAQAAQTMQASAATQTAENQALAKRAGAIEANQAHKDAAKGRQSANASQAGSEAKPSAQPHTADGTNTAQAKAADAPTSDIARMEHALRQAFQSSPNATPGNTPGGAAQPTVPSASQPGAEGLISARSGESAIDGASAAGNNTRANAAAAAKSANARPAFTLPAGRPAEQASVQIQNGIRNGADRIQIKLTPANLGSVEVKLELAPDKTVQAIVTADKAETLDMLERDGRVLQKALEEAGLRTNSDSLSFEQRDPGQSAHAGREDNKNASGQAGTGDTGSDTDGASETADIPIQSRRAHDGLIDIEA